MLNESLKKQNELEENLKILNILKRQKDEENEKIHTQLQEAIIKAESNKMNKLVIIKRVKIINYIQ